MRGTTCVAMCSITADWMPKLVETTRPSPKMSAAQATTRSASASASSRPAASRSSRDASRAVPTACSRARRGGTRDARCERVGRRARFRVFISGPHFFSYYVYTFFGSRRGFRGGWAAPAPISTVLVDQVGEGLRVFSQDPLRLALGRAPARDGLGEQRRARLRQQELVAALVFGRPLLDPAAQLHQGCVAAEAGLLELEPSVELAGPGPGVRRDRTEDAELTRREPQGAQGVVVDPRELATQDPRPARQTLASQVASDAVDFPFVLHDHICIYMERQGATRGPRCGDLASDSKGLERAPASPGGGRPAPRSGASVGPAPRELVR